MNKNMTLRVSALVAFAVLGYAITVAAAAAPKTYVWLGQLMAVDDSTKTITVKAPYREPLGPFLNEYKPGEKIRITWAVNAQGEPDGILLLARFEDTKYLDYGRVIPAEFVSVDQASRMLTFKTRVPDNMLASFKSVPSGKWVKVTSPYEQPGETAAIASVEQSQPPGATRQ